MIALRNGENYLATLFRYTPLTAVRHGVLGMTRDALMTTGADLPAGNLTAAAAPLCSVLGVADLDAVPEALRIMAGRPPRAVTSALRDPKLVRALTTGLDMLGLLQLSDQVATWVPTASVLPLPLSERGQMERAQMVAALRARCGELIEAWRAAGGVDLAPNAVPVDGRALTAAARAWQLPLVNGALPPVPTAAAALHPNRLGRTAAIVAFSRARQAMSMSCPAPEEWVFEAIAMVIAVGEAISPASMDLPASTLRRLAAPSQVPVEVRSGVVGNTGFSLDYWWPIFDSWGSQSATVARAIPTAWKLSTVEADVLVWALCSAAVRLAMAASAPARPTGPAIRMIGGGAVPVVDPWPAHAEAEFSVWVTGARSVWMLMQSARSLETRTVWPGCTAPLLSDDASWPWQTPSDGKLADVPAGESEA